MTCLCLTIASATERAEVGRILIGNGYRVWQQTIRVGGKPRKVLITAQQAAERRLRRQEAD